jgi:hypothetical protein
MFARSEVTRLRLAKSGIAKTTGDGQQPNTVLRGCKSGRSVIGHQAVVMVLNPDGPHKGEALVFAPFAVRMPPGRMPRLVDLSHPIAEGMTTYADLVVANGGLLNFDCTFAF